MTAFERNYIKYVPIAEKQCTLCIEAFQWDLLQVGMLWRRLPAVTISLFNDKWLLALFRYWSVKKILYYTVETAKYGLFCLSLKYKGCDKSYFHFWSQKKMFFHKICLPNGIFLNYSFQIEIGFSAESHSGVQ